LFNFFYEDTEKVVVFDGEVFNGLTSLRELVINHNGTFECQINQGTFKYLINLEVLDLSENRIEIIQPNTFTLMPKLKILMLCGNQIAKFPFFNLNDELPNIEALNLSANRINSLDLIRSTSLRWLDLRWNFLTLLP
jgi:Leucine-rich repeat (LRR) protein